MRPLICLAHALLGLTCTLQGCGQVGEDGASLTRTAALGSPAPEIEGKDLDGEPLRLSDYRGKVVLLSFYGEWCPYCVKQFPNEKALVDQFQGRPFVLLGVNSDASAQEAKEAAVRRGLTWRAFFIGSSKDVPRRYRVQGWPSFFLIDGQGVIRHTANAADREMEIAINMLLHEIEQKQ
jgi:peroxiredoxin